MRGEKPVIALTMGDPSGVGPEVILKSLAKSDVYDRCAPIFMI
jgi:4-hydroxy-L-threonine phosphate dehydrogenase PdxA